LGHYQTEVNQSARQHGTAVPETTIYFGQ
jgi:hypothetical protein